MIHVLGNPFNNIIVCLECESVNKWLTVINHHHDRRRRIHHWINQAKYFMIYRNEKWSIHHLYNLQKTLIFSLPTSQKKCQPCESTDNKGARGVAQSVRGPGGVCLPRGVSAQRGCLPGGWGCLLEGVCWGFLPRGMGVSAQGVSAWEGVSAWGCLPRWEVSVQGMFAHGPHGWLPDTPPVNRMTDRCKHITLPQLCCGR